MKQASSPPMRGSGAPGRKAQPQRTLEERRVLVTHRGSLAMSPRPKKRSSYKI